MEEAGSEMALPFRLLQLDTHQIYGFFHQNILCPKDISEIGANLRYLMGITRIRFVKIDKISIKYQCPLG